MSNIRLFADRIGHPSRFCIQFLRLNKIPFEEVHVSLLKGETRDHPDLPFGQVPVMKTADNLTITQSTSILRYLADTNPQIPDQMFPKSPEKKVKVNEFMDFFHFSMNAVSFNFSISKIYAK